MTISHTNLLSMGFHKRGDFYYYAFPTDSSFPFNEILIWENHGEFLCNVNEFAYPPIAKQIKEFSDIFPIVSKFAYNKGRSSKVSEIKTILEIK